MSALLLGQELKGEFLPSLAGFALGNMHLLIILTSFYLGVCGEGEGWKRAEERASYKGRGGELFVGGVT